MRDSHPAAIGERSAEGPQRVLIADDDPGVCESLRLLLRSEQLEVQVATSVTEVLALVNEIRIDLAILDLNYAKDNVSGSEGLGLLDRLRVIEPSLPVMVMTGWASIAGAIEAIRRGAKDYVEKPWDDERLLISVRSQLSLRRAVRDATQFQLANTRAQDQAMPALILHSPAMLSVIETIERVANSDAAILITGDHGTGKELIARLVHSRSQRSAKPFVTLNAGGLSAGVAESELFGHVKGSFTDARSDRMGVFELAHDGTLFLDEIGTMPIGLQPAVLRTLQTGEIRRVGSSRTSFANARLVSATNSDLADAIRAGQFREDLFYRINTVTIHLPPLRERPEDILPLARWYLERYAVKYGRPTGALDPGACRLLTSHSWPGNVRELTHAIERGVLMARGPDVTASDLKLVAEGSPRTLPDALTLDEIEQLFIQRVLSKHSGNVRQAAKQLGISKSALYRRLQQSPP